MTSNANFRKAAILIRSLDADTATGLLAQLSPAEAREVRSAILSLGTVDDEERADLSAEFRRIAPVATEDPRRGVELQISAAATSAPAAVRARAASRPFEFLEMARVESLVPYLAREHAQTVAVVLSYLPPARAAQLLAALPEQLQAEAIERLSMLGDTDPNSLQVLERELADWVTRQQATRSRPTERSDAVVAILAAADGTSRTAILANLLKHNRALAEQIAPIPSPPPLSAAIRAESPPAQAAIPDAFRVQQPKVPPLPCLHFDDLARLDPAALTAVLRTVDADVLVLALAGASDALVERISSEMPRKVGKAFRRRLSCLGPTRLRDVEAAQHEVAAVAAQVLHTRRAERSPVAA